MPDDGNAYVAGHSLLTQPALARRNMGYCPQFRCDQLACLGMYISSVAMAGV